MCEFDDRKYHASGHVQSTVLEIPRKESVIFFQQYRKAVPSKSLGTGRF
jgi:hypothetical protein